MSIWTDLSGFIRGGWRTYGINTPAGPYAFDSRSEQIYDPVSAETAIRLSAVWACLNLRAESIGTLPIQIRDRDKNVLLDHPLSRILRTSPNFMQTPAEFFSQQTAHVDMQGNGFSIVHTIDGRIVSLEPIEKPEEVTLTSSGRMNSLKYIINDQKFSPDQILHLRGFTLNNNLGLPRIQIGQCILSAQMAGNAYAQKTFKQGLKIGGFFEVEQNLDKTALTEFRARLDQYAQPENAGRWMTLLKGMKPIGGAEFGLKASEVELLASRYFGIEEICRLFNCPPQLIGHSDKASSWASSLENINLFFTMYSVMPTIVRYEQRMNKTLLTDADRGNGVHIKFNIQGLLRGDMRTQMMFFASALQNGYYNRNEVRDLLDRSGIGAEGDSYLVQMNMAQAGDKLPVANQ